MNILVSCTTKVQYGVVLKCHVLQKEYLHFSAFNIFYFSLYCAHKVRSPE